MEKKDTKQSFWKWLWNSTKINKDEIRMIIVLFLAVATILCVIVAIFLMIGGIIAMILGYVIGITGFLLLIKYIDYIIG